MNLQRRWILGVFRRKMNHCIHKTLLYINVVVSTHTENVNGLNSLIKRHRVADLIKKRTNPTICCLQETHLSHKDKDKLKGKKIILKKNSIHRKEGIELVVSDKIDFKIKKW